MNEFAEKVVLITGAGHGAGRQLATAFSSLGAVVAANDINPISLDETIDLVKKAGGKAGAYVFDIAKRMPIEGLVTQVLEQFGRIDILVNHASVRPDASLLEMDEWDYHRTLDVNLAGPFFTMQQVGRVMRQQGGGVMVNLLSASAQEEGQKGYSAYLASQAGVMGTTQAAASELAAYNIRVNTVYFGRMDLGLAPSLDWDRAAYLHWQESFPNIGKAEYQDLVNIVLFLCSHAAKTLSGLVIPVGRGEQ